MSVDLDLIEREIREAGAEGGSDVGDIARLVGATFCWAGSEPVSIPYNANDDAGCREALIAQWEGLAPVVKMPKRRRDSDADRHPVGTVVQDSISGLGEGEVVGYLRIDGAYKIRFKSFRYDRKSDAHFRDSDEFKVLK